MDATGIFLGRPDERRTRARRTACLTVTVSTYERWGGDCRQHACFRWPAVRLQESNLGFINPAVPGFFYSLTYGETEHRVSRVTEGNREDRKTKAVLSSDNFVWYRTTSLLRRCEARSDAAIS